MIINDEEFAAFFKESIATDYKEALLFMNVDPDISLMKFRKILESLCLQYKQHYHHEFINDNLFENIEELGENDIICGVMKESFHDVRILTNSGVHYNDNKVEDNGYEVGKEELINNAIRSREGVLNLLEHAFLGLRKGTAVPKYERKIAGGQENKNLWYRCLSSSDYSDYFLLGKFYQELAECYESLIQEDNSFATRANSMFTLAVESFKNAFNFAAKLDVDSVVNSQGKGISISPESYQSLFNYSLLCFKRKVDKHDVSATKVILRALIKRGYTEAYAYLGWYSYLDKDYKSALKYLTHKKVNQDVFTFHKLGLLYSEGKSCSINLTKAIDYFVKAAELGDVDSMFQLGKLYHSDEGEIQDDAIAQSYLQQAVASRSVDAMVYLDENYLKIREKLVDDLELVCDELAKVAEQEKKVPYRAVSKERRNALCGCGSGKKYKICCGVGL